EEFERKLKGQQSKHRQAQKKMRAEAKRAISEAEKAASERDLAKAALAARTEADEARADHIADEVSNRAHQINHIAPLLLNLLGTLAIFQYFTGWLTSLTWTAVGAAVGLVGLYDAIMHERPKIGVPTILRWYCRWALRRRLTAGNLAACINDFCFDGCK